jgi:hypothetical protein
MAAGNLPNASNAEPVYNWRCGGRLTTVAVKFLPSTCVGN